MKFTKKLRHNGKGKVWATIYKRPDCYRLYWRARIDGKPRSCFKDLPTYSAAKRAGDKLVADLAKGAQAARLSAGQATDALAARLKTIPHKKDKRPALSPEHHYNTSLWLREFAKTFQKHAVSDLRKEHIAFYMGNRGDIGPKTRNERRGLVRMFLQWAVERDYLPATHRLFEASALHHEQVDTGEIGCYTADQLRAMLERASQPPQPPKKKGEKAATDYRELLPVLALAGLAGLRLKEAMRLTFAEVFHRPDHIEVNAMQSKTRSRRLIPICATLAGWIAPYHSRTGPVWAKSYDMFHEEFAAMREELEIPNRRNGLRHSFISAHFAAYSDENLTAAQAGNSPDMIHHHYKGLLTKQEGEAWFAVSPAQPANVIQLGPQPKRKAD